ncbi:MAG: class I SAM-dependent methyltransferase [Bryobacteraceae bacterium]
MSACLLCGSESAAALFPAADRLHRTTARRFAILRCGQCGLLRLDPRPDPAESRQYHPENYWFAPDPTTAGRLEESYRRLVLRDHARFVERALGDSSVRGPLLDVGCGGGLLLGMMRERGFRVVGLDNSPAAAAIAWSRQRVPAVCGVLEHAPLRAGSFAAITMFHVLEHVHDPRAYVAAAHRLLAPGGRLIAQTPNAASWQFRLLGPTWSGLDVPRHLFDFRASDLERLLESGGFTVLRRNYFSWRDNPASLATSIAPGLDPMGRRTRRLVESALVHISKDLAYLTLVVASVPFALLEAAFGASATIMIEARKR